MFLSHFTGSARDSTGAADPIETRIGLADIKEKGLGQSDKGDFGVVKAYVCFMKHSDADPWYAACPTVGCNKKVTQSTGGGWQCDKCNQTHAEVCLCA